MKLLIATKNQGKFQEITAILKDLPLEFISLNDTQVNDSDFVENGKTFAENAEKKAVFYAKKAKMMTLADDSGLMVEALKDELGVNTRRWGAGEKASDKEWLGFFLQRMKREKNRKATFVSYACLVDPKGKVLATGKGEVQGTLTRDIRAPIKPGVPLSSIFLPVGFNKVHSAMTFEEKGKVSHRGKAVRKIKEFLEKYLLD